MISHVIESLPIKMNDLVLWCHTTSPLFDNFEKAINQFMLNEKKGYDSLVTTTRYNGFLLDQNLNPLNYQWGKWHKYSQFLKSKFYSVNGALFIARKKTFLKYDYVIGSNPTNFICTEKESIDIDNDIDFQYAQFLLNNAKKTFLKKIELGKPCLGTWSVIPSIEVIDIIASSGFDFIILDQEHGPINFETIQNQISICENNNCSPIVRVPGVLIQIS